MISLTIEGLKEGEKYEDVGAGDRMTHIPDETRVMCAATLSSTMLFVDGGLLHTKCMEKSSINVNKEQSKFL